MAAALGHTHRDILAKLTTKVYKSGSQPSSSQIASPSKMSPVKVTGGSTSVKGALGYGEHGVSFYSNSSFLLVSLIC